MNRVLLLLDDYSEMTFIQILLKKLGFDVDVLQNHHILGDRLLSFRPQILLLTEESKKYPTEAILKSAMAQVGLKVILLKQDKSAGIEVLTSDIRRISSPVQHVELLEACAQCSNVSAAGLIEKFKKFKGQLPLTSEQKKAFGITEQESENFSTTERTENFRDYLSKNVGEVKGILSGKEVQAFVKKDRSAPVNEETPQDIDVQRRSFVKHLFKKTGQ